MPWIAFRYARRDLKLDLCEKFDVKTVPTLIFFNEKGEVVKREGRHFVTDHSQDIDAILANLRQEKKETHFFTDS
ncbi:hypothetical protein PF002_g7895 [Phytophthora fragariae]|uniref:Thioredoxin domain-containing protein n=1 Tax=Phytophthora fragariae TaxID=53985 RepID=A0A6A3ZXJ5_9STRA|nr:hypothetical protein PF006_g6111 [Phytophthora fragariae]KAE9244186.1 hypothetical protein PF002_g7895 [Phytophthora fragariae]KAE9318701.1 hypothetical protein PF001_g6229 [Phytophthora fragariae]